MTKALFAVFLTTLLLTASSFGSGRRFTYVYEATTLHPGEFEFENWVTWKTHQPDDSTFDRVDFRHELKFGITERLQAAVFLADWFYEDGDSVAQKGFTYQDSALNLIYNLSDPVKDPLGLAIFGEVRAGYEFFLLEGKLIAQKNFGHWVFAYNATLEAEWEGEDLGHRLGVIQQSLGASYEINHHLAVGAELVHDVPIPEWESVEGHFVFGGPNISVRGKKWWATLTALGQLTRGEHEPDFQLRAIVGVHF